MATSDDSDETAKAAERSDDNADDDPDDGADDDDGATAGTEIASTGSADVSEVGREGELEDEDALPDEADDDTELMLVNGVGDKNPAHIYCLPVTRYSIGFINKASPGGTR